MSTKEIVTFEVYHLEFFIFMNSEPNEMASRFEIKIREIENNKFEACYLKELVDCLFHLKDLRKENVKLNKIGVCFKYQVVDNNIYVDDKEDVLNYLSELKALKMLTPKKQKSIENIDYLLEYEDELDKDLTRELVLIHQFENMNIPIGVSGIFDEKKEKINFEELEDSEIEFINHINWGNINRLQVYRTLEINETEFLFDFMFGVGMLTSDVREDFKEITKAFFDGSLEVDEYNNVTLNRDLRRLNKNDKKLNYLLKQRRSVSSKMNKISRIEIKKI